MPEFVLENAAARSCLHDVLIPTAVQFAKKTTPLPCELVDRFWPALGFGPTVNEFPNASVSIWLFLIVRKCYSSDEFIGWDERRESSTVTACQKCQVALRRCHLHRQSNVYIDRWLHLAVPSCISRRLNTTGWQQPISRLRFCLIHIHVRQYSKLYRTNWWVKKYTYLADFSETAWNFKKNFINLFIISIYVFLLREIWFNSTMVK